MGGKSLVDSQGRNVGFLKKFQRIIFLGGVGWGGWKKGVGLFFSLFLSFVTW
jgi:hypothetical protein